MDDQNIVLNLEVKTVDFILHALGELPSKTGAWDLINSIREQALPQIPQEETITEERVG